MILITISSRNHIQNENLKDRNHKFDLTIQSKFDHVYLKVNMCTYKKQKPIIFMSIIIFILVTQENERKDLQQKGKNMKGNICTYIFLEMKGKIHSFSPRLHHLQIPTLNNTIIIILKYN